MLKHQSIVSKMTLEKKVAFCSGDRYWKTKSYPEYGIHEINMSDGPHGIRKQLEDSGHLGAYFSEPATCFPAACLSACSFDTALLEMLGEAIGREAHALNIQWVLGPGANLKRNPLCGRNFEYFSEDPFLSGEMAAHWIMGLQRSGVSASLKHFACNNQESKRMSSDSIVDARALHELYFAGFEHAIKKARPWSVMCAYNKINGCYASDHVELLRHVLRAQWQFGGVIVSDWGAVNDRIQGFEAGMDLEMPGSKGYFDKSVIQAVKNGVLPETRIDESVDRLLDLIERVSEQKSNQDEEEKNVMFEQHHELARKIARESAVLLKNEDDTLPMGLKPGKKTAVIGALAEFPRYQVVGSSHIHSTSVTGIVEAMKQEGYGDTFDYARGYLLEDAPDDALMKAALELAERCEQVIAVIGLTEDLESEGFDRSNMKLPNNQNILISALSVANPKIAVVLVGGAPVEMPWLSQVKSVLNLYLAGQAGGLAAVDLITGAANPCGKLAETYPIDYEDVPSAGFYENGGKMAEYREGLYIGYRYFDKAKVNVQFPFGHGLSYTSFEYSNLKIVQNSSPEALHMTAFVKITNTGTRDGAEIVQFYVARVENEGYQPEKVLAGFRKIFLKAKEMHEIECDLWPRAFQSYDVSDEQFKTIPGKYGVSAAASAGSLVLNQEIEIFEGCLAGKKIDSVSSSWHKTPEGKPKREDFEALLGYQIKSPEKPSRGTYTTKNTLDEMKDSFWIKRIIRSLGKRLRNGGGDKLSDMPTYKMLMENAIHTPLERLTMLSPEEMPPTRANLLAAAANHDYLKVLELLLRDKKGTGKV
ncbi:MAG: glycoside hydrolase family 3 C-terminal domain-containing protein [Erysipelotrichaceae bacterium]|nr:glycoside hydrolase family 3 C-terminal domain-containing protein [Erysipelotrichaceae bacterium]